MAAPERVCAAVRMVVAKQCACGAVSSAANVLLVVEVDRPFFSEAVSFEQRQPKCVL